MSCRAVDPFWNQDVCESEVEATATDAKVMGKPHNSGAKALATMDDNCLNKLLAQDEGIQGKLVARQAFRLLKQDREEPHMALPVRCVRHAPDEPNVYTDGSWLFSLKQFLALAHRL